MTLVVYELDQVVHHTNASMYIMGLRKANCPNFIPVFDSGSTNVVCAISLSCETETYDGLHDRIVNPRHFVDDCNSSDHNMATLVQIQVQVYISSSYIFIYYIQ